LDEQPAHRPRWLLLLAGEVRDWIAETPTAIKPERPNEGIFPLWA
jgi:hypothetical protein